MDELNKEKDSHELDKIRMKKMQELMEAQKRQQASQERVYSVNEKLDYILKVVLNPDAYTHLNNLKTNEPNVYQYIFNELISEDVYMNIDYLIAIINRQGGVPRRIPLDIIIFLERKAKGIKGKISVKKGDGEVMDLGSYLTK
jgi:DNA-binding TFAR19-related protein (PDSD5 family)